ncbi:TOPRIM nucleotidyl transferase/hydrolase domain-containing protein [Janibacter sp. DB-40]|uniref:TOPRIM nucleotidyl transferase/hydrolase domain-containing protein n=1 Tax=Janibacter sp. DB-40 TaxID=3028808 RepID=UPI002406FDB6|nr:TOPRIM nucleotidyl transferase/hydrolase domain-containing protein [Janibacter sp. DB-40]
MSAPHAVVLVEGNSDRAALHALARRLGRDLAGEGVEVVAMGGIGNVRTFATTYGPRGLDVRLAGLYDIGEKRQLRVGLAAAGVTREREIDALAAVGFHACIVDLEDELVRSLGVGHAVAVVEKAGEGRSLRRLAHMPEHRGRPTGAVLRRFLSAQSGRKAKYAELFVEAMELDEVPEPLMAVLDRA